MGQFADAVANHLQHALTVRVPTHQWVTEHRIAGTPVDVAGLTDEHLVLIELEWRRADPADNTAKLFRHLYEGSVSAEELVVCQVFTRYYDLQSGGHSSKRKNAEFVGNVAARTFGNLTYHPVEFDIDPPKRGADRPDGWRAVVDETAHWIADLL